MNINSASIDTGFIDGGGGGSKNSGVLESLLVIAVDLVLLCFKIFILYPVDTLRDKFLIVCDAFLLSNLLSAVVLDWSPDDQPTIGFQRDRYDYCHFLPTFGHFLPYASRRVLHSQLRLFCILMS